MKWLSELVGVAAGAAVRELGKLLRSKPPPEEPAAVGWSYLDTQKKQRDIAAAVSHGTVTGGGRSPAAAVGEARWPHVRALRADELEPMRAYLAFVQREPLPTTDEGTRERLAEAAQRWPAIAALFGDATKPGEKSDTPR